MRVAFALLFTAGVAVAQDKGTLKPIAVADLKRTTPVSYEADVAPLFAAKCTVCHAGKQIEGGFDMSTYASLMKGGGKRGKVVVPGKADASFLWLSSSHRKGPVMPPKSEQNPLTETEVALLKLWIDQGAAGPAVETKTVRKVVVGLPPAGVVPVRAVAISPDKSTVAVGRGNQVHLFAATKAGDPRGQLLDPQLVTPDGKPAPAAHLSIVEALAYSPDGKTLATGSFRELTLWDTATGKPRQRIGGFADRVVAIAYSPDGKTFATGGGPPSEDGEIRLFDAVSGKPILDIKAGHSDTVFGVAFSPDGTLLATAGADKFVRVFSLPAGKLAKSFEGHTQHAMDVGWTPDGKKLVSAGAEGVVKVWDYAAGEKARDITAHQKQVTRLAVYGPGPTFATASGDGSARLWNADTGGQQRGYTDAKDYLYAVATSKDGQLVVTGGEEGIARLYENGQMLKALIPGDGKVFSSGKEPKTR